MSSWDTAQPNCQAKEREAKCQQIGSDYSFPLIVNLFMLDVIVTGRSLDNQNTRIRAERSCGGCNWASRTTPYTTQDTIIGNNPTNETVAIVLSPDHSEYLVRTAPEKVHA